MQIHGSMLANVKAAAHSAQKFRGKPVYGETLQFWSELLAEARRSIESGSNLDDRDIKHFTDLIANDLRTREIDGQSTAH